jgi:hypothetical protein
MGGQIYLKFEVSKVQYLLVYRYPKVRLTRSQYLEEIVDDVFKGESFISSTDMSVRRIQMMILISFHLR